jgi:Flp pilus assembly secretin CpaC
LRRSRDHGRSGSLFAVHSPISDQLNLRFADSYREPFRGGVVAKMKKLFLGCALAGIALALSAPSVSALETISVTVDQAILVKLPERASTLVIGNPLIFDASIQPGGLMILTGKGYGATNLIALDRQGQVLMERSVSVKPAKDSLVVYRGTKRETYSCLPDCEPRITLGDDPAHFGQTIGQATTRARQAESSSAVGTGRR